MKYKTFLTIGQKTLIKVLQDKISLFGYGITGFHTRDVEELLNIIEKLTKNIPKEDRIEHKYSECCNALIYFDDQSLESCTNCDDRI